MVATIGNLFMREILPDGSLGIPIVLSIYNPCALAAGSYVPVDYNAPASPTSPTEFSVPFNCQVVDFIPTAATGMVEFTSGGRRTNIILDYAAFGASVPARPTGGLPKLKPGVTYRLLVLVVLAT